MSGSPEWRTPPAFFETLHREFHFNVDAAAAGENALVRPCSSERQLGAWCATGLHAVGRFYTAQEDGTRREHYGPGDRVWCNPPYSPAPLLYRFVQTAALTSREQGALWVMLLNASCTDTRWFHDFIWDGRLQRPQGGVELRLFRGRIRFLRPDGAPGPAPRYASMVVVFHPGGDL